jgi:hypothetical protein
LAQLSSAALTSQEAARAHFVAPVGHQLRSPLSRTHHDE